MDELTVKVPLDQDVRAYLTVPERDDVLRLASSTVQPPMTRGWAKVMQVLIDAWEAYEAEQWVPEPGDWFRLNHRDGGSIGVYVLMRCIAVDSGAVVYRGMVGGLGEWAIDCPDTWFERAEAP